MVELGRELRTFVRHNILWCSVLEDSMRSEVFGDVDTSCALQLDGLCQFSEVIDHHNDEAVASLRFLQRTQEIDGDRLERLLCRGQTHRLLLTNQTETVESTVIGPWMRCRQPSMASNKSDRGVRTSEYGRDSRPSLNDERDAADEAAVFRGLRYVPAPRSRDAEVTAHHPPSQRRTA